MRIRKPIIQRVNTLLLLLIVATSWQGRAQGTSLVVNLAQIDGVELNPENVFNYEILNNTGSSKDVAIQGSIQYRNSALKASYSLNIRLQPGNNPIGKERGSSAVWSFSESGLKELFKDYGKLPQGTYEYCVSVSLKTINPEYDAGEPISECTYQTVNDIFLINLIEPENNAKLYELNPMFSWVVNYPFASQLTYRIRIAQVKEGQNNENAINRNNPIYQDNQVMSTSMIYPATAKPLVKFQPYAWTVDAYYKGILLGGAEAWRFTIIEDSLLKEYNPVEPYYDFVKHYGESTITAIGEIKLKYTSDMMYDSLDVKIMDDKGETVKIPNSKVGMHVGDNYFIILLHERVRLGHGRLYNLQLINKDKQKFNIPFKYTNPVFLDGPKSDK